MTREWPAGPQNRPTPRAAPWPPTLLAAFILALFLLSNHGALDAIDPTTGNVCQSLTARITMFTLYVWAMLKVERHCHS